MLARADAVDCRAVKPRPNSDSEVKHASTTLKDCLSALCRASPELLADPRTDHSVYALDPLQVPELMVGRGLLTWLMSESSRVVGVVKEDYVDGEEMEVLEVKLSLTPTVAVSRAQHATSLQNISGSHPNSANPSPPTTPLTQPTVPQPTRASARLRVRSKKESSVTPPPTHQPARRGRPKKAVRIPPPPEPEPEPEAPPPSPGPSRSHSRVSSISSLALSQVQAPPAPAPLHSNSSSTTQGSVPPSSSRTESQHPSPSKTLARLLASSNGSSDPNSRTPLLDSLLERLRSSGYMSAVQSADQGTTGQSDNSSETQKQALLTLLRLASSTNGAKSTAPSPAAGTFAAPSPRNIIAHSPSNSVPISAPSPATSTTTPCPPSSLSNLGVRKRETEDGEIVEVDPSEAKRARVGVGDVKPAADAAASGSSIASPPTSATSPNPSIASPNLSFASPSVAAPSPSLSGVGSSAASPNFTIASPAISPAISAASPYAYPQVLGPPRTLTATVSQPVLTFSHAPLQTTSSQPTLPSSQPKRRRQTAQTDLPPCTGSFITPRSQIGQPRAAPVEPGPSLPPGRKATTPVPTAAHIRKSNSAGRPKRTNGREMSEQEVREMLAGGHYPSGGLQDEHRRLFGAAGRGKKDGDKALGYSSIPSAPLPPSAPDSGPPLESTSTVPKPRTRAPRPREPRPAIPKRSPVAPPVSRLPMMMTSPIRATGVSSSSLPPSFSPLRRLLKNAGVKSIEEVLNKGGVMGLKDEMKREDKREREVVDLTSDADEDDAPVSGRTARTPPRTSRPMEAPPTTPRRRSAPFKPSTPPRKAHTSPPTARASESPLFRSQDIALPPSSPPPMSDSDAGGSVRGGDNNGYTSEGGGYSSEAGAGYDGGVSSDAPPDPDVEMSDTDDELWDETIRPVERDDGASEHVGSVLGQMELGLRVELGNRLGEPQMDFDSLTCLLDMLGSHGIPYSEASGTDGGVDVGRLDQQTLDLARAEVDLANVGLDFSWLDSMSQGGQGIGMQGLMGGDEGEGQMTGMEFGTNVVGTVQGGVDGQTGAMSEEDLAQLLAAFGSS
ncbi:hypothetical protein RHS02_08240, partial [Rhizoctonia solani]